MGRRRWLHALAVTAFAFGIAAGQKPAGPPPPTSASGSGSGSGSAVKPPVVPPGTKVAGSSDVESTDIPAWQPSPPRFAVVPFENQANVRAFDWLIAGAPFEIAEKTEDVLGLEPANDVLYVEGTPVVAEPDPIAAFAAEHDNVPWVITGWADRPNWKFRINVTLWKVSGKNAVVAAEATKTGEPATYHALLGAALGEVWKKNGVPVDLARAARLQRPLATDLYAVNLMGRGLGHMIGAFGTADYKNAQHDLERAVFIDPKCPEAQRLIGELYLAAYPGDPKWAAKAAGKFAYANDLAPDDISALRAAAQSAADASKFEVAKELWKKLVTRKPWDLDARYALGAAMWGTGDAAGAEKQLEQVTAHKPDHLPARRVLVLIHSSRSDTPKLVKELEAIAQRAPTDLAVKADLATAYGALGRWDRAVAQLEQIAAARPADVALAVRIGDARRRMKDLDGALASYRRAEQLAPDMAFPAFATAQALFDAGRLVDANRAYTHAQKYDLASAEQALGAIAYLQNRADDAAWYLRRATKGMPRSLPTWRAEIAAELKRRDSKYALMVLDRALDMWPRDADLLYLAGVAHAMEGDRGEARDALTKALEIAPGHGGARGALGALSANGAVVLTFTPELVRPWGDAQALEAALERFSSINADMAKTRVEYQKDVTKILGVLGKGPEAPVKQPPVRQCPLGRVAQPWQAAQQQLWYYVRSGDELEATYRFIARHDEIGATAALLPNARAQVAAAKKLYRTALADVGELRAEWVRGLVPELRMVGCYDKLLAAAVADPEHYRVIVEDRPEAIPATQPPRPKARATFYVDNTRCPDAVDVWIDGIQLGQVAPGRRSALVADGGERTLCLIVPGAAQCGDKGTVRQVYLHDGWAVTMQCPK